MIPNSESIDHIFRSPLGKIVGSPGEQYVPHAAQKKMNSTNQNGFWIFWINFGSPRDRKRNDYNFISYLWDKIF